MSEPDRTTSPSPDKVPPEQSRVRGVPYDWREPTADRTKARWWNPDDRRLFTPKAFGMGWDINFYWLVHPAGYFARRP